jgi:ABC-type microcin C transport system duplicated ATPase subunit YejF
MLGAIGIGDAEHWLAAYPHELSGSRAFEVYPRIVYCIESIQVWNRLQMLIPRND